MSLLYKNGLEISESLLESYFVSLLAKLNNMTYNNFQVMSTGQILGFGQALGIPVVEEVMSTTTEQYFNSINIPQYTERVFDNIRYRLTENYLEKWYDEIDNINDK